MLTNVINTAACLNGAQKAEMLRLTRAREETLEIMYREIKDVCKADRQTRNFIYDSLNKAIRKLV